MATLSRMAFQYLLRVVIHGRTHWASMFDWLMTVLTPDGVVSLHFDTWAEPTLTHPVVL